MQDVPGSPDWRSAEFDRLVDFAEASARPGVGFGWLDDDGRIDPAAPFELWITARMTHIFSLAALRGRPGAAEIAVGGIDAMRGAFADAQYGGWYHSVDGDGRPLDPAKTCYEHAFVLLASSSALAAGVPGAAALFESASGVLAERFWSEDEQRCVEAYDRTWTERDSYRGANSNMHSVEAFLAAAGAANAGRAGSGEVWLDRALAIAGHLIDGAARANNWRLPEHFDADWHVQLDYNEDAPADQFRPYGATPGHALEWGRLLLDLDAARPGAAPWLVPAAQELFAVAVETGWGVDGHDGFVYTVDWSDRPVVTARMHWVVAEGVLTADALHRRCGDAHYGELAARWWAHIERHFVDRARGSWHHELSPNADGDLVPSTTVWHGKPDIYHAAQAVLLPDLALYPAAAWALRGSALG